MLGYLSYKAVRGQWRLYQRSRKEGSARGPGTMAQVFFLPLPFTVLWWMVAAVQRAAVLWLVLTGVNALLIVLTLLSAGTIGRMRYYRAMERKYAGHASRKGLLNPGLLREQASFLDELGARPSARRHLEPALEAEPERLTQALFSVPCPVASCLAEVSMPCAMGVSVPVALVNKDPVAFCHTERIRKVVRSGKANADDILAQFGNNAPEGLQ